MRYILGICNVIGTALLAYVLLHTTNYLNALEQDYETTLNKYRTENATQIAYVTEVYHLGDWSTILADTLAIQDQIGTSEESRVRAVKQVGVALSFEETICSYLIAFDDSLTTVVKPYTLIENEDFALLTNITFDGGTLINYHTDATISLDNTEELIAVYRDIRGIKSYVSNENVLEAMKYDHAVFINSIISEAMGHTTYKEQDRVYIPIHEDNNAGINRIENQTIMMLSSSVASQSPTTTLAAYTKTDKRMWCEIIGPAGIFYCYSDELPNGYAIRATYNEEYEAARNAKGRYYIGK